MVMSLDGHYILRLMVKTRKESKEDLEKQVDEESVKVGLRREDALC